MAFVPKCSRQKAPVQLVMGNPVIVGYTVQWSERGRKRQQEIRGGVGAAQRFASRLPFGSGATIVPRFKK